MFELGIYCDRYMLTSFVGKVHMYRLGFINLINHFLVRLFSLSTARCSFSVASLTMSPTATMAVSSAKIATVASPSSGRSLMYIRHTTGSNTLPSGTPNSVGLNSDTRQLS